MCMRNGIWWWKVVLLTAKLPSKASGPSHDWERENQRETRLFLLRVLEARGAKESL